MCVWDFDMDGSVPDLEAGWCVGGVGNKKTECNTTATLHYSMVKWWYRANKSIRIL